MAFDREHNRIATQGDSSQPARGPCRTARQAPPPGQTFAETPNFEMETEMKTEIESALHHVCRGNWSRAALTGFALLTLLAAGSSTAAPSARSEDGRKDEVETLKKLPGLVQLYTFEEGQGLETRNLLDSAPFSAMVIAGKGVFGTGPSFWKGGKLPADYDYPRWVAGRWPGKSALSIGTEPNSIGRTHFYGVDGKNFTVELWVRTLPDAGRMFFASVGDGNSSGWRLNSSGRGLEFVLGRKPGTGPGEGQVAVQAGDCLRPQVWQQIVASLDGEKLRLYVDGKLAGEKTFDGIYTHVATPAGRHRTPEIDYGGLQLGTTSSQKSASRFDIDELAIYARALDPDHVAQRYTAGNPGIAPEEQVRQHQAELARQAQLDAITLTLPTDTFGYFPNDQAIPVTVAVGNPAAPLFGKAGTVEIEVSRLQGESLVKENLPLAVGVDGQGKAEYTLKPDRCGLYVLNATLRDQAGEVLKSFRVDFARRLPLPPRDEIPGTTMLESYVGVDKEMPIFGTTIERIIQPVYGRTADGGPNFADSDAFVEKCRAKGLDLLYCFNLSFWDTSMSQTAADVKADPVQREFLRTLVTRYKGKVKYWEFGNEPNAHGVKPEDYVAGLKQAHATIKEIDPEAKIVGPCGTSDFHDWTEAVLAAGGGQYLDILSFHNYIGASPLKHREFGKVEAVKASMRKHIGRELPMWNSECGMHQPTRVAERPATDEEILKMYAGRAGRRDDGVVGVGVDAIAMFSEHIGACRTAQSLLVERAEGVLKYFMLMRPSGLYGGFSSGGRRVTEKGVALAAVQSLLIRTTAARFIPTGISSAGVVALTDSDGKTHAALFADKKIRLVFSTGLKEGTAIVAMDYLGNPLSFQVGANGLLALELWHEPVYLLNVPASFAVNADGLKLSCLVQQLEPMSQVEVLAEVRNPSDREASAKVVADVSAGVATAAEKEFKLAPGETRRVPIAWRTGGMEKGRHALRAQLLLDGQPYAVVEKADFFSHGTMTRIPRLPGAFALDGDTAKWADIPAETANTREQAVIGRPVEGAGNPSFWDGPKDLSYTFKTAWTEAGIHFLLEVTDNVLRPSANAEEDQNPWLFDGVELFLDVRPQKERQAQLTAGALQAGIALRLGETAAGCPVTILGKEPLPVTIRAVSRKTDDGYLVEGTILPVEGSPLKLADGTQINVDVSVNDNDDTPDQAVKLGRRVQMALHGTAGNNNDTSNYGRYLLSAEAPQANLVPDGALLEVPLSPADFRGHAVIPGWRLLGADKMDAAAKENLFWGAKEVDGRNALWIGTQAEAHLENAWELERPIPVKAGTGYSASCQMRGRVEGKAVWAQCAAIVIFYDAKGAWLGHRELGGVDVQKTPGQWRPCGSRFITPAGTASLGFRAKILSKGVKGFADYYWTGFELREIPERQIGLDAEAP